MSWAAHELESYVIQKHLKVRISYLAVLLGCLLPDMATKLWTYGFTIAGTHYGAANPPKFHRGWPGLGFGHSLLFGVLVATIVLWRSGSWEWALGLVVGQWAHCLTDTMDSVGTMLFFPFTTQHYHFDMWAYAATAGRYGDAAAYYSSLGGIWDLLWLVIAIASWRVFTKDYFDTVVRPHDPAWGWLKRRFDIPERALLAMYRAYFFYGACRIFAWGIWAHAVAGSPWDLRWGGPAEVEIVKLPYGDWQGVVVRTLIGVAGVALTMYVVWRLWWRPRKDTLRAPVAAAAHA